MKFGLSPTQYHFISQEVVEPLQALGAKVYCYGSRARLTHQPFSDLDLMVETSTKSQEIEQAVSNIQEILIESNFPFKVDLVFFSEFADSYKDGYLRDRKVW